MSADDRFISVVGPGRNGPLNIYRAEEETPVCSLSRSNRDLRLTLNGRPPGIIRRTGGPIRPEFQLLLADSISWTLTTTSLLRRQHRLITTQGSTWSVRTPFFGTAVSAHSADGRTVVGRAVRTNRWQFSILRATSEVDILGVLAFIHWRCYFRS